MFLRFSCEISFMSRFTFQILSLFSFYPFSLYTSAQSVNRLIPVCIRLFLSLVCFLANLSLLSSDQSCVPSVSCVLCVLALFSVASGLYFFVSLFPWTVLCLPFVASILNTGLWILKFGHQLISKAHFFLFLPSCSRVPF